MYSDLKGPIESFSWGKFVILGKEHSKSHDGKVGAGKDIRLIGQEVSKWKERQGHELFSDELYHKGEKIALLAHGTC